MTKCNYIRPDGTACRNRAITDGKRCSIHRLDGGPSPLGDGLKHGQYRRLSLATNKQEALGEQLLTICRLEASLGLERSPANLRYLSAAIGRRIERVFDLLLEGVSFEAADRDIETITARERVERAASYKKRVTYADTNIRSPRHWAVYGVIACFAKKHHRSPSHSEISRHVGASRTVVRRYIRQLERDGLVYRSQGYVFPK